MAPPPDRSMAGFSCFTDVDVADLTVALDRLLRGKEAERALGAGVVERDVQRAVGADGLFDERDDVMLPADIGLHEHGASAGPKLPCIPCLTRLSPLSTIAHEDASVSA